MDEPSTVASGSDLDTYLEGCRNHRGDDRLAVLENSAGAFHSDMYDH